MALVITIAKRSVTKIQDKLYHINLNLTCMDNAVEVINQDFSQNYRTSDKVGVIVNKFKAAMQQKINDYKEEQTYFTAAALNTAVTNLQNGLVG